MTVGAILLAAGSSQRMGTDKLTAELGGKALGLHMVDAIVAAGLPEPVIATAPDSACAQLFEGHGRRVEVTDHMLGQGHSIAAAIGAVPADWSAVLICLADMPFVRPATLALLARSATEGAVARPFHAGQAGNPVLWGRNHFPALAGLSGDRGGRVLLAGLPVIPLACDDPGILIDIDTPAALGAARRSWPNPP